MSLIKIDYSRKGEGSIFKCDRCNKKINTAKHNRYIINIKKSERGAIGKPSENIKKLEEGANE